MATKTSKTTKMPRATKADLKKYPIETPARNIACLGCGESFQETQYYGSDSVQFQSIGKIPYCKPCLDKIYQDYYEKYKKWDFRKPERKAIERICQMTDLYYSDKIYDSALKIKDSMPDTPIIICYIKQARLMPYCKKHYNSTLQDRFNESKENIAIMTPDMMSDEEWNERLIAAERFFGRGFEESDYLFLQEQYEDWTSRHECETKVQEEMFKQICFTQLELMKANRVGADTKDLNATFLKQLDAAKLQPKQNLAETTSEVQTLGTLIDKWENTRPIPEPDEEFKDVDNIGLYVDSFFRGHTCKMLNIKNAFSNLYSSVMKKYTVQKPEYEGNEDSEALFDSIFGHTEL